MANIVETARAAGCFATLLTAVEVAGLTAALEGPGPFTVFAPVDDAFAALPAEKLAELRDNGGLDLIYAHLASMAALPELAARAAAASPEPAL